MDSKGGKKKSRVIVPYLMKPPLVTALKMFVLAMESRNSILLIVTMQLKSSIWLHFMKPPPNIHLSILQGTMCPDQVPVGRNTHLHACKIVSPFYNDHLMGNDETNKACLCCLCSVPSPLATATTMSTQGILRERKWQDRIND
ncbi:hypothetical protein YC2023_101658 [Brassica napus]